MFHVTTLNVAEDNKHKNAECILTKMASREGILDVRYVA